MNENTIKKWDDLNLKTNLLRRLFHMDLNIQATFRNALFFQLLTVKMLLHKHNPEQEKLAHFQ